MLPARIPVESGRCTLLRGTSEKGANNRPIHTTTRRRQSAVQGVRVFLNTAPTPPMHSMHLAGFNLLEGILPRSLATGNRTGSKQTKATVQFDQDWYTRVDLQHVTDERIESLIRLALSRLTPDATPLASTRSGKPVHSLTPGATPH